MTDIVWEDPPPPIRRGNPRIDWCEELRPLTDHPGKWARVRVWKSKSSAAKVAKEINSKTIPLVVGMWEARTSRVGEQCGLWVKYEEPS